MKAQKREHTKEETLEDKYKNICRFLVFVLRHKPQVAHLKLDEKGFAESDRILSAIEKRFKLKITQEELNTIINRYVPKFFLIESGKIKAKFGHSIILSMNIPDGFESVKIIPHSLYACINRGEMWNVSKSGLQSNSILDGMVQDKKDLSVGPNLVVGINTEKSFKANIEFYHNSKTNKYFCRFIPSTYLKFEL